MKRTLLTILIITSLGVISSNAQGTMRADGANVRIVASGAPSIVLNNMHFRNNAANALVAPANSEFRFVGNTTTEISSTGPFNTTFANVEINKTGGSEIDVITNNMTITTAQQLEMVIGNIDMNNNLLSTWELGTAPVAGSLGTLNRTTGHLYNGYFRRWYTTGPGINNPNWDVPIGMNAGSYNFARAYHVNATSGGTLRVRFVPGPTFYTGLPLFDATNPGACTGSLGAGVDINNYANEGYWDVIAANGIDVVSPYTIQLCYNNFTAPTSEPCLRIIKSENLTSWMQEGVHGTVDAVNNWVTRDLQTGFPSGLNSALFTIAGDILINPLPIELSAFNANCGHNSIMVSWTTASENGNSHFILERTKDLLTWDVVAVVPSQNGYSNISQTYHFEDQVFNGTFYYRLTQVDINGDMETFPPVTVNCSGGSSDPAIVNTYQNNDGQVTIVMYSPADWDYVLDFYDLHGRKIIASKGTATAGNNTITLDGNMLRDAYYLIHIQIGDKNLTKKVFVR